MSFSRAQQRIHGALVHEAWLLHCEARGIETGPGKNREAYVKVHDAWYKHQLLEGLGVDTTAILNNARDFERAVAHLERSIAAMRAKCHARAPEHA